MSRIDSLFCCVGNSLANLWIRTRFRDGFRRNRRNRRNSLFFSLLAGWRHLFRAPGSRPPLPLAARARPVARAGVEHFAFALPRVEPDQRQGGKLGFEKGPP